MIYNFENFVKKIDENVNSAEFMNRFGLSEEENPVAADAPVDEPTEKTEEKTEEHADLEEFKKEHLDVMFNELGSEDFDKFYTSEFKAWKEMEDGEEKDKKKEEILTKIKDMFKLGEEAKEETETPAETAPEEAAPATEEPAGEEEKG